MKVLMISTDKNILKNGSDAQERMLDYGGLFTELHILLVGESNSPEKQLENIFIYPKSRLESFFWRPGFRTDVVSAQDPFENGFIGYRIAKRLQSPLQLQVHTDFLSPYFGRESMINKTRIKIAKFLIPRAKGIRVVSERIKKSLVQDSRFKTPESKITVLPIFVDTEKIKKAEIKTDLHKKYPESSFIILMASRLTREKNIEMAIEAMKEIRRESPKTLLLIVGEGPEKSKIKNQILSLRDISRRETNLKLEKNVVIEPWTDDLVSYYKTADLFLLTSNYEGYGRTVIEAMASGCPVVMTDVGLASEIFFNCLKDAIIPVGNIKVLAEKILDLFYSSDRRGKVAEKYIKIIDSLPTKIRYLEDYKETLTPSVGRKIKVLFAMNNFIVGGAEKMVLSQISAIDKNKFEPWLMTILPDPKNKNNFSQQAGFLAEKLVRFEVRGLFDFKNWLKIFKFIKSGSFDAVITGLFLPNCVVRSAAVLAGVPVIISNEYNIYNDKKFWQIIIDRILSFFTDVIIVSSKDVLEFTSKQEGISKHKFFINFNAIPLHANDREWYSNDGGLKHRLGINNDEVVITTAGRLVEQKGHTYLLKAAHYIKRKRPDLKWRILISGEGVLKPELEHEIEALFLKENMALIGLLPMQNILSITDIFTLPSLWEGLSLALLESMDAGKASVVTNVSGSKDAVSDGTSGFIVPPGEVEELAEKIIFLIDHSEERERMGKAAKRLVEKYSIENNVRVLESLIINHLNKEI